MAAPFIAPADPTDDSNRPSAMPTFSRLGAAIASPVGILIVIPGLVALVGLFLTLAGDRALRGSNLEMARDRLSEQTRLIASSLRYALGQSEPVLDRLVVLSRAHGPNQPVTAFAHSLADLINGRPGMAYVSASFSDGTFQAAYIDDDGVVRFQHSRVERGGTIDRRYDLLGHDGLALQREVKTDYDPRQRDFYRLAVQRGERAWTKPYPFYKTHYTGVTRTQPVYVDAAGKRHLHAVVTVDFDVNVMSVYLKERQLPGARALLYAADGTLLAYPGGARAIQALPLRSDRPLRYDDLSDTVLAAFFKDALAMGPKVGLFDLKADGQRYLAAAAPASDDPSLAWSVAYLAPETYFLKGLHTYERRSFVIGGIAVLTAMIIGWLYARHVVRVRADAARARAEAQRARQAARELGSYRLVACLGKGGMGEVWKAEHRLLAREAAIKLINPEAGGANNPELRERFRREAETLASLRSRNTIELFDYGVADDGTFYFVMELLDGMDLETLVKKFGPQPAGRVVQILTQALSSLAEAHEAGLVHRDIKPANIFICRAADEVDVVKVLDFGLVRLARGDARALEISGEVSGIPSPSDAAAHLTQAGGLMGTPAYMAPEQALGHAMDHRADLYALGCVAFFLLTGRLVFEDDNPLRLMLAHVQSPPPALRELVNGFLPEELSRVVDACLAKAPKDRPSSARELGRLLRAVPIPPEAAFTDSDAEEWWNEHRPRRSIRPGLDSAREFTVLADAS